MKTAFKTGPGFFCGYTHEKNKNVPKGVMRIYFADIQAQDIPLGSSEDDMKTFMLLPAMCDGKPEVAKALIELHHVLHINMVVLKVEANK